MCGLCCGEPPGGPGRNRRKGRGERRGVAQVARRREVGFLLCVLGRQGEAAEQCLGQTLFFSLLAHRLFPEQAIKTQKIKTAV